MIFIILSVAWLLVPFFGWQFRKKLGTNRSAFISMFLHVLLIGSFLYVLMISATEWELKRAWDPDGNGRLDNPTTETREAMAAWSSDAGRRVAPLFSVPVTFIWICLNFAVFSGLGAIRRKLFGRNADQAGPANLHQ